MLKIFGRGRIGLSLSLSLSLDRDDAATTCLGIADEVIVAVTWEDEWCASGSRRSICCA